MVKKKKKKSDKKSDPNIAEVYGKQFGGSLKKKKKKKKLPLYSLGLSQYSLKKQWYFCCC